LTHLLQLGLKKCRFLGWQWGFLPEVTKT